ncbi:MAG: hypothetical protein FWD42_09265, partial [Solirubrobacterales bacterium]|nr:hypothetical protein [Solirubrobacterales bacterium]
MVGDQRERCERRDQRERCERRDQCERCERCERRIGVNERLAIVGSGAIACGLASTAAHHG